MKKTVEERVIEVLISNGIIFDEDDLSEEFEMDSITYISLLVLLEEEFKIVFSDEQLVYFPKNLKELVVLVQETI